MEEGKRLRQKQLLDMLKIEEAIVSTKGFKKTGRNGPQYFQPFKDSITCLNFSRETLEPCDQCWLMSFVPKNYHEHALPCHQIPMNKAGETVVSLESRGDVDRLEKEVLSWLRSKIGELERELGEDAKQPAPPAAA